MSSKSDSRADGLSHIDPLTQNLGRLALFGWNRDFERDFRPHAQAEHEPGRVVLQQQHRYALRSAAGEISAEVAGRLLHLADEAVDLPAVGDWVVFHRPEGHERALIQTVLPRRTKLSRKVAGRRAREQVVAANVDTVFVVMGLDGDFNLRRLERFLVSIWESGARPVVVLNKADLAEDTEARRLDVIEVAPGVEVFPVSCLTGEGLGAIVAQLTPAETVALVGSSGVGKSSLINRLLGDSTLRTGEVRAGDDRGRHTTTHRQLFRLPGGALLIDNPGIRELVPWSRGDGLGGAFEDIRNLAEGCRFRDCTHQGEPGCAVAESITDGRLDSGRLRNYHELERELRALEIRRDKAARRAAGKKAQAMYRSAKKAKRKRRAW